MVQEYQLKNGLKVVLKKSHKSPVVALQIWVQAGSADEQKGLEGVSHFIEHLVFKGSPSFKVGEMASTIEGHGGEFNAYTTYDRTVFHVTLSKHYIDKGILVLSEMMGHPTFDAKEIDNEREVVIEEIKRSADQPSREASRHLFSTIYQEHPYGNPVLGYEEVIRNISQKEILTYFHEKYVPKNMTLVAVGDFEVDEMKEKIEKGFSSFEDRTLVIPSRVDVPSQEEPRLAIQTASFEETFLNIVWPVPTAQHEDTPALEVLSFILGSGDSSRLMKALRIENSITKYTSAGVYSPKNPGFIAISSTLNIDNLDLALEKILSEILLFLKDGPSQEELDKALLNMESHELYSLETVDGFANKLGIYDHLFQDPMHYQTFLDQMAQLTKEKIHSVAKKYLVSKNITLHLMSSKDKSALETQTRPWLDRYVVGLDQISKEEASVKPSSRANPLSWKIPTQIKELKPEHIVLPNGAKILLKSSNEVPVVQLKCAFLGGLRVEPDTLGGTNELLSHTWLSGSKNYSEPAVHKTMDRLASSLHGFSGRNTIGLSLTTLSPMMSEMMDLFWDTLQFPLFPTEALDREKIYLSEQIKTREDSPASIAFLNFLKIIFKNHPYAKDPSGGDLEIIQKITHKDVLSHYRRTVSPKNMVFSLVGDFDPEEWVPKISAHLDQLNTTIPELPSFSYSPPLASESVTENSSKNQTHIIVGYPGLTFSDPDRYTLQIIQSILGGQGGRLFTELRDKASLAYSVSPISLEGLECGYFGAYIACSPEKAETAKNMLEIEFGKLMDVKVDKAELERSQKYLIGSHDIQLQRNAYLCSSMLFDEIYGNPFDEALHIEDRLRSVTAEDILDMAHRIFQQPSVISIVGPGLA